MNNDNTNQRKVKVPFDSPIDLVNIVREVNEDVRDVAKDLDDDEGTHGVGEVDHADAEVEARDPPNAPRDMATFQFCTGRYLSRCEFLGAPNLHGLHGNFCTAL